MKQSALYKRSKGFTLIEILIVTAIFTILATLGLFMTMDVYRGISGRSERDIVVVLLQKARSQSLNNIDQASHGFCVSGTNYVLFEGTDCTTGTNKELVPMGSGVTLPGFPASGVSFSQLSGNSNWLGSFTVTQSNQNKMISINSEGLIDW